MNGAVDNAYRGGRADRARARLQGDGAGAAEIGRVRRDHGRGARPARQRVARAPPVRPLARTAMALAIDALFPFGPYDHMTIAGFG